MQVSVQNGEGLVRRMVVKLPEAEIFQEVEKRLKDATRTAHVNGFRPGKAPAKLVRARYASRIEKEVFDDQISLSFQQAVAQEKLYPVNMPMIEKHIERDSEQANFSYTATFEVFPEVIIAPLDSYTVQRPVVEITDADVDTMLDNFRRQRRTWQPVERPAQQQDRLLIDFRVITLGVPADDKKTERTHVVLDSNLKVRELEAGLIGMSAGEFRAINLPPKGGHEMLCEVSVQEVAEPILPELDGDFAKSFGVPNGDIEVLRSDTRKNMTLKLAEQIRNNIKWQVMNLLQKAHPIQLPNILVEREKEIVAADARRESDIEIPQDWLAVQAVRRVALRLIISEIIHQHSIVVDEDKVREDIENIASSYENPQDVIHYYEVPENRKSVENMVLEDQAVEWVLKQVQVEDVPTSFREIMAAS